MAAEASASNTHSRSHMEAYQGPEVKGGLIVKSSDVRVCACVRVCLSYCKHSLVLWSMYPKEWDVREKDVNS